MKITLTIFLGLLFNTVMSQLPHVTSGSLKRLENFPSAYVASRNIDIWLPDHYDTAKKYSVLYMHDGQALFDSSIMWNHQAWYANEAATKLMKEGKVKEFIIVGIWNNGAFRFAEYFPQKALPFVPQKNREKLIREELSKKPIADQYLSFIVKELKPYIDAHFSVYPDKQHTFIAGSSMGGMISLYAVCEYPDVFEGAACLSIHWPGSLIQYNDTIPAAVMKYLSLALPSPNTHRLYFDYGSATIDAHYLPLQTMVNATMKTAGYTDKNFANRFFPGEEHSENAWRKRLEIPLYFLLKKNE